MLSSSFAALILLVVVLVRVLRLAARFLSAWHAALVSLEPFKPRQVVYAWSASFSPQLAPRDGDQTRVIPQLHLWPAPTASLRLTDPRALAHVLSAPSSRFAPPCPRPADDLPLAPATSSTAAAVAAQHSEPHAGIGARPAQTRALNRALSHGDILTTWRDASAQAVKRAVDDLSQQSRLDPHGAQPLSIALASSSHFVDAVLGTLSPDIPTLSASSLRENVTHAPEYSTQSSERAIREAVTKAVRRATVPSPSATSSKSSANDKDATSRPRRRSRARFDVGDDDSGDEDAAAEDHAINWLAALVTRVRDHLSVDEEAALEEIDICQRSKGWRAHSHALASGIEDWLAKSGAGHADVKQDDSHPLGKDWTSTRAHELVIDALCHLLGPIQAMVTQTLALALTADASWPPPGQPADCHVPSAAVVREVVRLFPPHARLRRVALHDSIVPLATSSSSSSSGGGTADAAYAQPAFSAHPGIFIPAGLELVCDIATCQRTSSLWGRLAQAFDPTREPVTDVPALAQAPAPLRSVFEELCLTQLETALDHVRLRALSFHKTPVASGSAQRDGAEKDSRGALPRAHVDTRSGRTIVDWKWSQAGIVFAPY